MNAEIRVFDDLDALSAAAAHLFVETSASGIAREGRALAALSGGSTPAKLYKLLAQPGLSSQVDWARLHLFWGDERCVPPDDPGSNYGQAREELLAHVPIPAANVHRIPGELEPERAAAAYALTLRSLAATPLEWPRFDLALLGMGDDGHTASLFPGSPVELPGATAAVTAHYEDRPASRVTLTAGVLNSSRYAAFLVSGASKSRTVAAVLKGDYRPVELPAQRIQPIEGKLIWMLDREAAGAL